MNKFFKVPFAASGDKSSIPDTINKDGYISFTEGWGEDYQRNMRTDAKAKPVDRKEMNGILNSITVAIRQYQTDAFPEYITAADNGGTQYPYSKGTVVRYMSNDVYTNYVSLVDNNTSTPGSDANWQVFIYKRAEKADADLGTDKTLIITPPVLKAVIDQRLGDVVTSLAPYLLPVGVIVSWGAVVPPDGWIEANGQAFDRAKNPKLLAVFPSGNVPDLRGRVVRGWAHGSTVDPDSGRAILSTQEDAFQEHTHIAGTETSLGTDVPVSSTRNTPGGGEFRQYRNRTGPVNPDYLGPRVATETRAKNMALMYIVKTDQADNITPDPTPTNIVLSPSSLTLGTGHIQQFTATVLPANLASKFPVTWTSTNPSIGTINANGLFTAAGVAGTTDVIASVSSGLSVKVTVRVDILLTAIGMAAIPSQTEGNTYNLVITKTPSNATEGLVFVTSDTAIAGVTADGILVASGAGTANITVTGIVSGKTASRPVTVTPAVVTEKYLQINNNLSEIAAAGATAQTASRGNLGLKALAVKDSLTATEVGAVPLATAAMPAGTNLNTMTTPGQYFQNVTNNATLALNYPAAVAGVLVVYKTGVDTGGCRQVYMPYNSTVEYQRYAFGSPLVFSAWDAK